MKFEPTRRDVIRGGMTAALSGTLAVRAMAGMGGADRAPAQGGGDPIVSVPPTVSATQGGKFYVTVYPPDSYAPNTSFTVKIVRLRATGSGGQMSLSFSDEYLDGIASGGFQTTVVFEEESGPKLVSVNVTEMQTSGNKHYAAVAFNATGSSIATFQLTP